MIRDFVREKILGASGLGFEDEDRVASLPMSKSTPSSSCQRRTPLQAFHSRNLPSARCILRQTPLSSRHVCPVPGVNLDGIRRVISDIAARRAEIGFSTSGHTGIDINVYAYGAESHRLAVTRTIPISERSSSRCSDSILRVLLRTQPEPAHAVDTSH